MWPSPPGARARWMNAAGDRRGRAPGGGSAPRRAHLHNDGGYSQVAGARPDARGSSRLPNRSRPRSAGVGGRDACGRRRRASRAEFGCWRRRSGDSRGGAVEPILGLRSSGARGTGRRWFSRVAVQRERTRSAGRSRSRSCTRSCGTIPRQACWRWGRSTARVRIGSSDPVESALEVTRGTRQIGASPRAQRRWPTVGRWRKRATISASRLCSRARRAAGKEIAGALSGLARLRCRLGQGECLEPTRPRSSSCVPSSDLRTYRTRAALGELELGLGKRGGGGRAFRPPVRHASSRPALADVDLSRCRSSRAGFGSRAARARRSR